MPRQWFHAVSDYSFLTSPSRFCFLKDQLESKSINDPCSCRLRRLKVVDPAAGVFACVLWISSLSIYFFTAISGPKNGNSTRDALTQDLTVQLDLSTSCDSQCQWNVTSTVAQTGQGWTMIHWVYLKQMRSEANLKKLKLQHPPRDAVACAVAMLTVGAPIDLSPNLWMMIREPNQQGFQRSRAMGGETHFFHPSTDTKQETHFIMNLNPREPQGLQRSHLPTWTASRMINSSRFYQLGKRSPEVFHCSSTSTKIF